MTRWFYLLAFVYFGLSLGLYVHPCRPRHFTKLKNYFHCARGRHHRSQSAVCGLLRLQCEIWNLHFCVFWSTGSPCGSGLACNSAWNVMQRTVLYSQTVLWAGNNTLSHTHKCARLLFQHDVQPPSIRLHSASTSSSLKMFSHFLSERLSKPPLPQPLFTSDTLTLPLFDLHHFIYLKDLSMTLQVWNLLVIVLKIHLSWHYAAYSCCLSSFPAPLSYIINSSASHYIGIKKKQVKACFCVASNSILTRRWWKHRQLFVPRALKRRKWLQMWGPYKATSVLGPASLPVNFSPSHWRTWWQVTGFDGINKRLCKRGGEKNILWSHKAQTHTHTHTTKHTVSSSQGTRHV